MSTESDLAKQLELAIAKSLTAISAQQHLDIAASAQRVEANKELSEEALFWSSKMMEENLLAKQLGRRQREEYANKVFLLVALWIGALFVILLCQATKLDWHPFSDSVLIALISSMTINLIGTLVIVLKYIFHNERSSK